MTKHSKSRSLITGLFVGLAISILAPCLSAKGKPPKPDPEPSGPPIPEIAYRESRNNQHDLVVANRDGSNKVVVYRSSENVAYPEFSPTDDAIAFSDDGVLKLLSYSVSDTTVSATVPKIIDSSRYCYMSDISPDGEWIVYHGDPGSLYLKSLIDLDDPDNQPIMIFGLDRTYTWNAVWLSSGAHLAISYNYYPEEGESEDQIIVVAFNRSSPVIEVASIVAGPLIVPNPSGIVQGVIHVQSARTYDGLVFSVRRETGEVVRRGKNIYNILDFVAYEWKGFLDGDGGTLDALVDAEGAFIQGKKPCYSPDDMSIVVEADAWDVIRVVDLADGSSETIASGRVDHCEWKP